MTCLGLDIVRRGPPRSAWRDPRGATAVEYVVLSSLVLAACFIASDVFRGSEEAAAAEVGECLEQIGGGTSECVPGGASASEGPVDDRIEGLIDDRIEGRAAGLAEGVARSPANPPASVVASAAVAANVPGPGADLPEATVLTSFEEAPTSRTATSGATSPLSPAEPRLDEGPVSAPSDAPGSVRESAYARWLASLSIDDERLAVAGHLAPPSDLEPEACVRVRDGWRCVAEFDCMSGNPELCARLRIQSWLHSEDGMRARLGNEGYAHATRNADLFSPSRILEEGFTGAGAADASSLEQVLRGAVDAGATMVAGAIVGTWDLTVMVGEASGRYLTSRKNLVLAVFGDEEASQEFWAYELSPDSLVRDLVVGMWHGAVDLVQTANQECRRDPDAYGCTKSGTEVVTMAGGAVFGALRAVRLARRGVGRGDVSDLPEAPEGGFDLGQTIAGATVDPVMASALDRLAPHRGKGHVEVPEAEGTRSVMFDEVDNLAALYPGTHAEILDAVQAGHADLVPSMVRVMGQGQGPDGAAISVFSNADELRAHYHAQSIRKGGYFYHPDILVGPSPFDADEVALMTQRAQSSPEAGAGVAERLDPRLGFHLPLPVGGGDYQYVFGFVRIRDNLRRGVVWLDREPWAVAAHYDADILTDLRDVMNLAGHDHTMHNLWSPARELAADSFQDAMTRQPWTKNIERTIANNEMDSFVNHYRVMQDYFEHNPSAGRAVVGRAQTFADRVEDMTTRYEADLVEQFRAEGLAPVDAAKQAEAQAFKVRDYYIDAYFKQNLNFFMAPEHYPGVAELFDRYSWLYERRRIQNEVVRRAESGEIAYDGASPAQMLQDYMRHLDNEGWPSLAE